MIRSATASLAASAMLVLVHCGGRVGGEASPAPDSGGGGSALDPGGDAGGSARRDAGKDADEDADHGVDSGTSHVVDAGPFACGTTTCAAGDYCTDHPPGIVGPDGSMYPDAYICEPVPASCTTSPTCACIEGTIPQGDSCSTHTPGITCTADAEGHVTIGCIGA